MPAEVRLHDVIDEVMAGRKVKLAQHEGSSDVELMINGGSVADKLRNLAVNRRADLVIIGRGCTHQGLGRLQATSYAIVREAPCPVLSA
jgi:nucleotide-binding universal stress UspA family protein